jgi:hypothetical protein
MWGVADEYLMNNVEVEHKKVDLTNRTWAIAYRASDRIYKQFNNYNDAKKALAEMDEFEQMFYHLIMIND